MHLGHADRQVGEQAAPQSAQVLVQKPRRGERQRRLRGHLSPKAAAALLLGIIGVRLVPIYPCHVAARDMRTRPIGTGPFKFVEFKPNELIRVIRNPDYWKEGRPYLDGIEYPIIP